ncbi:MAG: hypothetical protein K6F75_08060 [Butyrivibrio sp.]|nr:hypothetical protein [Butyrivibrio sp.]
MSFKNISKKNFGLISFIVLTIFFIGQVLIDGPVICKDTQSYIDMNFTREAGYSLILFWFRSFFEKMGFTGEAYGQPVYLLAVAIFQSIFWIIIIWKLGMYIYRFFGPLLGGLAVFFQIAVAAINRYLANRGSMYSESIMTEAFAMPLFLLITIYLWDLFEEYRISTLVKLFVVTVLTITIRKHMMVLLATWMGVAFVMFLFVKRYRDPKRFLVSLVLGVAALISVSAIDKSYNHAVRGVYESHVNGNMCAIETMLYTQVPESKELFSKYADSEEFPHLDELYAHIYDTVQEKQYSIEYYEGFTSRENLNVVSDWVTLVEHYAQVLDDIGYSIIYPSGNAYVAQYFPELDNTHAQIKEDQVEKEIFKVLLRDDLKKLFTKEGHAVRVVLVSNIIKGFVLSVANTSPQILIRISGFIYILFFAIFIMCLLRGKERVARMMFIVFAGLAVNCVVTGAMIFPQPRYMCYSMGLFYLTLCCGILYR